MNGFGGEVFQSDGSPTESKRRVCDLAHTPGPGSSIWHTHRKILRSLVPGSIQDESMNGFDGAVFQGDESPGESKRWIYDLAHPPGPESRVLTSQVYTQLLSDTL